MLKINLIKDLHKKYRLERDEFKTKILSTIIGEIDRKIKGHSVPNISVVENGVLRHYHDNVLNSRSPDAVSELRFLRESGIIENRMNSQEIDLNLISIYKKKLEETPDFTSNKDNYKIVLTEFVKNFVPTVADFETVKERYKKIFKL